MQIIIPAYRIVHDLKDPRRSVETTITFEPKDDDTVSLIVDGVDLEIDKEELLNAFQALIR